MSQQHPPDQGQSQSSYQQQPYPQLPAQPPFYPPVQQPPKKRGFLRSPLGIGCGVVAALVVLIIVIIAIASAASGGGSSTANNPTTPAGQATTVASQQNTPTTQPTSAPTSATNRVGSPVTSGTWQLTINTVKTSIGDQFSTPKAGNTFLVINFTAKNTAASNQDMNPFDFTLRDAQGNTYQYTVISENNNPDGTVVSGQQLRGDLAYEVPKLLHSFVLQFDPPGDLDNSQVVQWQIKD